MTPQAGRAILALLISLCLLPRPEAHAATTPTPETFAIAAAPQAVATGTQAGYQPGICFSYAGLRSVKYTTQLWLLDSYHWWCASDQFCPYKLDIDNTNGQNSAGTTCIATPAQITFHSAGYQWLANLISSTSPTAKPTESGVDQRFSAGIFNVTPPILQPIANQQVEYGNTLTFKVTVTAAASQQLVFSLAGAPVGASISNDGTFTYTPTVASTSQVLITVADASKSYVSSSQVFTLVATGGPTQAPPTPPPSLSPTPETAATSTTSATTAADTTSVIPTVGTSAGRVATNPKTAISSLTGVATASTMAVTTTGAAATTAVTAAASVSAATTGATIASTIAASTTAASAATATSTTGGTTTGGAAQFPPVKDNKFSDSILVGGLYLPTDYAILPDGSMLIAEKAGRVRMFQNDYLLPDLWLDLSGETSSFGDRGLNSIAIDPDFATNGYVYLGYTVAPWTAGIAGTGAVVTFNRIVRYTNLGTKADPTSRFIVIGKDYTDGYMSVCGSSHAFGAIRFAADKSMLFSMGDGANFENTDIGQQTECDIVLAAGMNNGAFKAQDMNTLNGKISRVDRFTGLGLPDNPFYDAANPVQSRVWALGMRNPFRFDIKPDTPPGTILVTGCDVGWATYEEVNIVQAGANLGWPCWEGLKAQPEYGAARPTTCLNPLRGQLTRPIVAWNHQNASQSSLPGVIGNAAAGVSTYAGTSYPAAWQGGFWFGDYQVGWVKVGFIDLSWQLRAVVDFAQVNSPISFGRHPGLNGDIIYISFYPGEIHRIQYGSANPVVKAAVDPPAGPPGTIFQFISDDTHDTQNRPLTFAWDFGDGQTSTLPNPTHQYATAADFHVKLTVSSSEGSTTKTIKVSTLSFTPVVYMSTPAPGCTYNVPQDIQFFADTSDSAGPVTVNWDVQLVHNGHFHPYSLPTTPDNPATFTLAEAPDAEGAERYSFRIVAHAVNAQQIESIAMVSCTAVGSANKVPTAAMKLTPTTAASPYAVIFFDSLPSVDPDGDILWIDWDFGDGIHSSEQQVYHTYGTAGTYTVTLSIQDNYGGASTATQTITIT